VALEFIPWGKIARLRRDLIVTEKIDGTNAAVVIEPYLLTEETDPNSLGVVSGLDGIAYSIGAQSRKRLLSLHDDNFGFAAWVYVNAGALVRALGPGRHFGEWWGSGIQRGYGLKKGEKRFSLFNVSRHRDTDFSELPNVGIVPLLFEGPFSVEAVDWALDELDIEGSQAAPGFGDPEGVVVFHVHGNYLFKATVHGDEAPKSAVAEQKQVLDVLSPIRSGL
jgi:hypothetical protein